MDQPNKLRHLRLIVITSIGVVVILTAVFAAWVWQLNDEMKERIQGGWFRPPVELYARGETLIQHEQLTPEDFQDRLRERLYRERFEEQALYPNDFAHLDHAQCTEILKDDFMADVNECVEFRTNSGLTVLLTFAEDKSISRIFSGDPLSEKSRVELEADLFAQFYNGEPIMRQVLQIGDVPLECSQAVTAIEDSAFLEHRGFSPTGFLRALARNVLKGSYAQGGSTITQQLIKNYFLTPKKTISRKLQEIVMAVLLEGIVDKDRILESYFNVMYMGQRGPFQVIGLGAASQHYFTKKIDTLNLPECALLAAIINNPNNYNPFTHPDHALARRNLVLDRMVETKMISSDDAAQAKSQPLPPTPQRKLSEPAPYFTQAIFRELERLHIGTENGLRVYTTLDISAQESAQTKVLKHVQDLEANNKAIQKIKAKGKNLEASLISVDTATGEILALVGGRQFVRTQYNRVLDAHRQIGSIMKPIVYLTALESRDPEGKPYTATSLIEDIPFTYNYEGQSWSPHNYTKETYGTVPLFYALKNSLNIATAKLGLAVGLTNIIDVARRAGVSQSEMKPFPSLTLGAFEIYPWEVATAGLTIARFGDRIPLQFIHSITDRNGTEIYRSQTNGERVFTPEAVAVLIGMMKQTLQTGTARLAKLSGFDRPAAGKTGTTSDTKDTWFMGFTPQVLTVVWTGYDDNTPTGLTGANGALPLWINFMKDYTKRFAPDDFHWPDTVEKVEYTGSELQHQVPNASDFETSATAELIRTR